MKNSTAKSRSARVHTPSALLRKELRESSDSDLVGAALDGQSRAFEEITRRYQHRLINFVNRSIGDFERAEDIVQETFLRVYRHLARFDRSKKFSTWIYTIAGNLAKNELRNRSRNPVFLFQSLVSKWKEEDRPLEWEDPRNRPDDLYRKRFLVRRVEDAVAQLSPDHRVVFVLREFEGKSYEEIAGIVGCNLGTVKSRLNRARNNFARIVAPMVD